MDELAAPRSPARPAPLPAFLAITAAALFASAPALDPRAIPGLALTLAAVAVAGLAFRSPPVASLGTLLAIAVSLFPLPALASAWPAPLVVALVLWIVLVSVFPSLGGRPDWLRAGRIRAADVAIGAGFAIVAATALLLWWRFADPDLSDLVARLPAGASPLALAAAGLAFALLNAAAEEAVFRGAMQDALARTLRSPLAALAVQAAAFGLIHLQGFPRGPSGVVLATVYGAMMGLLRLRTGGLLAPFVAHVVADLVIFGVLASLALGGG